MRKKPSPLSDDDSDLFRSAVADVRPLASDRLPVAPPPPPPQPQKRLEDERQVLQDMLSDPEYPELLETGEELFFARSGLQHGVLRKLRRGQYSIGAELDLHGLTAAAAREQLAAFLIACRQRDLRCVRIIHGKGNGSVQRRPVLKGKVNHWLQQRDEVLAFCSARPVDGGTGAVYVLLKRTPAAT
ncbi:MAG: DNA mismatch repair protein MutS [Gammaproteobacteria bacterium HGW-Gammaproteobacteria-1]|jgi:DNA-nicking Smr family endonuclease|nr:MAG: DNA mismatch repair protein MutS [Gammaproteobacteria bacterium HGW-Gammaproteobacteria-1]